MKEKNKKIIVGTLISICFLGIVIWIIFDQLLLIFAPKTYVKKALKNAYEDNQLFFSILSGDINLEYDIKLEELLDNETENMKLKGLSVKGDLIYEKGRHLESNMSAGIGIFRPYTAYILVSKDKIHIDIPAIFEVPLEADWDEISDNENSNFNLFDDVINIDYEKLLENMEVSVVSRKDGKFKIMLPEEYNDLIWGDMYLYVDKNHKAYKLENKIMSFTLKDDDIKFEFSAYDTCINANIQVKQYGKKVVAQVENMDISYKGADHTYSALISGKISKSN